MKSIISQLLLTLHFLAPKKGLRLKPFVIFFCIICIFKNVTLLATEFFTFYHFNQIKYCNELLALALT